MAIPTIYRVIFVVFDILLPAFGIYNNIADPASVLMMYTPKPASPPLVETRFLLDSGAGWYAMLLFMSVYLLLKRPNDTTAWTALQGGTLMTDVFMLFAFYREMVATGRSSTELWSGQDWGNLCGYVFIGLVRLLFVSGVGVKEDGKAKRA